MTFDTREYSVNAGAPVELYEFTRGATVWRYTSSDEDQVYLGNTYTKSPVMRGPWERGPNADAAGRMEFKAKYDHPIAQNFIDGSPYAQTVLKVFVRHRDDSEFLVAFIGLVTNVEVEGVEATITARNLEGRLNRRVPRMVISRTCAFMLYDAQCAVNPASYDFSGTVSAVAGNDITVTGLDAFAGTDKYYFVHGYVTKSGVVIGFITQQDGDVIRLLEPVRGVAVSDTVVCYAGCDRRIQTCKDKFNNASRFGGHHMIPKYNPWEGITGLKEPDGENT